LTTLPGLFVVGTDTGVGKTRVAAAIARGLTAAGCRVGVLKPVATGAVRVNGSLRSEDAERLAESIGGGVPLECVAPLQYEAPLAPSVAARMQGRPLSFVDVERALAEPLAWWAERAEILVVEGVGGLLCPLAEAATVADLAVAFDFPLVVVARRGLGTLSHTLLTVEAARWRGLRVAGVLLNAAEPTTDSLVERTNAEELTRRLPGIAILAELPHGADPAWDETFRSLDWWERARPARFCNGERVGELSQGEIPALAAQCRGTGPRGS
jgi:dethiobiotin synthetase